MPHHDTVQWGWASGRTGPVTLSPHRASRRGDLSSPSTARRRRAGLWRRGSPPVSVAVPCLHIPSTKRRRADTARTRAPLDALFQSDLPPARLRPEIASQQDPRRSPAFLLYVSRDVCILYLIQAHRKAYVGWFRDSIEQTRPIGKMQSGSTPYML